MRKYFITLFLIFPLFQSDGQSFSYSMIPPPYYGCQGQINYTVSSAVCNTMLVQISGESGILGGLSGPKYNGNYSCNLTPGSYTINAIENCEFIIGYTPSQQPIYSNVYNSQTFLVTIPTAPCNINVNVDAVSNPTAFHCNDGSISITATLDDCQPPQYRYYKAKLYKNNVLIDASPTPYSSGSQKVYNNLDAGTYHVLISNYGYPNCVTTSANIQITDPACTIIHIDSTKNICDPTSFDGKIYATIENYGCASNNFTYELIQLPEICVNGVCPPPLYTNSITTNNHVTHLTFSGLGMGAYYIRTNRAGCTEESQFINIYSLSASFNGNISTCLNTLPYPNIVITGQHGIAPYTFTYKMNGGAVQTITTTATDPSVQIPVPTTTTGTTTCQLVSVSDANCTRLLSESMTVTVHPLPDANISGIATGVCQYSPPTALTLTGMNGTPPYTFEYNIVTDPFGNSVTSSNHFLTSNILGNATIIVPTSDANDYEYNLTKVSDYFGCSSNVQDASTVFVWPTTIATAYPGMRCPGEQNTPVTLIATVPANSVGVGSFNVTNPYVGPNRSYEYTYINDYGCPWTSSSIISTYSFCFNISWHTRQICIKAFIDGFYSGIQLMQPVLFNQGISNDPNVTDSIEIILKESTFPYTTIASAKTILTRNGTACSLLGSASPLTGYYYLVLKHRNGLETWSSSPVYVSIAAPTYYDFTITASKAFGNNMVQEEPNAWALYNGDLNQDENIDLMDLLSLETDISTFLFGYFSSDLNGDGNVDLLDSQVIENNVNNFVFTIHP